MSDNCHKFALSSCVLWSTTDFRGDCKPTNRRVSEFRGAQLPASAVIFCTAESRALRTLGLESIENLGIYTADKQSCLKEGKETWEGGFPGR